MTVTLRKFIRQAELYGVEGVWEAAVTELVEHDLRSLARRLAHLDPEWRIPGTSSPGQTGGANPHSKAAKCHANLDSRSDCWAEVSSGWEAEAQLAAVEPGDRGALVGEPGVDEDGVVGA